MHDDVMLNGVFRICLWLVPTQLRIPNRLKDLCQTEIALRLRTSREPRQNYKLAPREQIPWYANR